jgi:hypothetical protein
MIDEEKFIKARLNEHDFYSESITNEDLIRAINELVETYPCLKGNEVDIKILIMSNFIDWNCWDCKNVKYEPGCDSSPNGPAEPGYWYCGLDEKTKDLINAEGYEEGFGGCEFCPYFDKKPAKQRLNELYDNVGFSNWRSALKMRYEREIKEEEAES